ncbi:MAG: 50S ribosomal protein L9 [Clostridia bacterium]|nr:50S ribosomal protein L9 [Clostridia bacterium]
MKVILLQDIKGTGKKDQIVETSDGYARNYLLPRKLAKEATSEALNAIEKSRSADRHREEVRKQEAEKRSRELKGKVIQLEVKGGENGKLYGSVTNDQIANALKEQHGIEIDKRKLEQDEPIKSAGQAFVTLKLYPGISTRMIVNVKIQGK